MVMLLSTTLSGNCGVACITVDVKYISQPKDAKALSDHFGHACLQVVKLMLSLERLNKVTIRSVICHTLVKGDAVGM
jgi:hypothetical protein